ncbi:hypothetical protein [Streptomyces sp. CoT10]|uniref:hypothetical protein n=1 Tax=Streptomyces sp. CoT10 TaxID=2875762 RepID=UPI001CD60316|nr:hypothetical protein [Streptomyces sp. CoT10]
MTMTRSHAVAAAVAAAAALVATGITYATAATEPVAQTVPAVVKQAPAPAHAPMDGMSGQGQGQGQGGERGGGGGRGGYEGGGERGGGGGRGGNERGGERGGERGERGERGRHREVGRIFINERSYSARPDGCITVVSGLGSKSLNIRNDSRRGVEVFRGATCDNGAPIATVGPCSEANGVKPGRVHGGVRVKDGVVASFRVVGHRKGDFDDFGDFGDFDDFGF